MSKKRKLAIFGGGGLFVLYNIISGGGFVIEKTDSLATLGAVADAQLTDGASVYLKETPTTKRFFVPFVFYYFHNTYPFRLRFYGSTRDGSIRVSDRDLRLGDRGVNVVVTEVLYYRKLDDTQTSTTSPVFKASSWKEIVIRKPGEWIVESKGYVSKDGEKNLLTFPTMTIRQTEHGRIQISRGFNYALSGMIR